MIAAREGVACHVAVVTTESRTATMLLRDSSLVLRNKRTHVGLALGIRQRSKLRGHATRDRRGLTPGLEAGEVGTIAPRNRATQTDARPERRVVDDVDGALVVGRALPEPGEVAEVAACRKQRRDTRHLRDLVGVLQTFERFDHQDEDDVVVDGVAIAAGHAAPHPTVEEAIEARNWTYFPPLGRRSNGGGQAFDPGMWGGVPGGYRQTINDNIVLILMIETLEGLKNADEIAKVPGVSALFAASGDLGNFSGFRQGTPDYERAINIVHDATLKAGIRLCGPIAWRDRPDFTCFQAGSETAAIARGVAAELGPLANTQGQPEVGPFVKQP